jgi:hypothetical protein
MIDVAMTVRCPLCDAAPTHGCVPNDSRRVEDPDNPDEFVHLERVYEWLNPYVPKRERGSPNA